MKRLLFVLGGAAGLGIVAYFFLGLVAQWYGQRYIHSDEDISTIYLMFLGVLVLSIAVGGIGGGILHRNLTRRSSGRS
jgi:hypothetical protein